MEPRKMTQSAEMMLFCIRKVAERAAHFRQRGWMEEYANEIAHLKAYAQWWRRGTQEWWKNT